MAIEELYIDGTPCGLGTHMPIPRDVAVLGSMEVAEEFVDELRRRFLVATYFIASTRTSTIPGISIAGASPEATLYTPALDVEYLVHGKPISMNVIPVTPDGIPTPALLTRVALELLDVPTIIVDAGSFLDPRVPHIDLPSRRVGGRIDVEDALPMDVARNLFEEAKLLGKMLGNERTAFVVGESMPGGTTTAMTIMEALGFKAVGRVSSADPNNPHELKKQVFSKAVQRSGLGIPVDDPFLAVAKFGDPLHVSIAGFVAGLLERGSIAMLAGGTQMCSVLAILRKLGIELRKRVAIGTTRWIIEDRSSDIVGLVKDIAPEVPILATKLSFENAPYQGLRAYERGYVKEGVGAGGTLVALSIYRGTELGYVLRKIFEEYERLLSLGVVEERG